MRILFCGTPQFAVPTLKHLLAQPDFELVAVFTQPDRPRGRGNQISSSPVKEIALAASLTVHQPEKIRAPEVHQLLQSYSPDFIVIIAYGQIIPVRLLPIPKSPATSSCSVSSKSAQQKPRLSFPLVSPKLALR